MTQEQKDLLLRDLCARLPHNVAIDCKDEDSRFTCYLTTDILREIQNNRCYWEYKPYLVPLSSMTEEQKIIYGDFVYEMVCSNPLETQKRINEFYDWLNKNHFDYRGLIPADLAIDATGLNVY